MCSNYFSLCLGVCVYLQIKLSTFSYFLLTLVFIRKVFPATLWSRSLIISNICLFLCSQEALLRLPHFSLLVLRCVKLLRQQLEISIALPSKTCAKQSASSTLHLVAQLLAYSSIPVLLKARSVFSSSSHARSAFKLCTFLLMEVEPSKRVLLPNSSEMVVDVVAHRPEVVKTALNPVSQRRGDISLSEPF